MPWCPKCNAEYREGFATCADCGEALTDKPPELRRHEGLLSALHWLGSQVPSLLVGAVMGATWTWLADVAIRACYAILHVDDLILQLAMMPATLGLGLVVAVVYDRVRVWPFCVGWMAVFAASYACWFSVFPPSIADVLYFIGVIALACCSTYLGRRASMAFSKWWLMVPIVTLFTLGALILGRWQDWIVHSLRR